ncbi:hypothetical protein [Bifidobacterium sp.]|uniref:hypothetical protein n=1 Tax=Bifidobacterium sp. TaxID=41200 RepID=UPI00258079D3|nr:hypothetical protein [Bifidobacterium sp.]MBS5400395.1 hypothetical protein [Bifidobacterium sp.]
MAESSQHWSAVPNPVPSVTLVKVTSTFGGVGSSAFAVEAAAPAPNVVADFLAAMDCDEVTLAWRRSGARQPFEIKGPEGIRCVVSPVVRD